MMILMRTDMLNYLELLLFRINIFHLQLVRLFMYQVKE